MIYQDNCKELDAAFYVEKVAPVLPPEILDFHTHIWKEDHWKDVSGPGAKYMVFTHEYGIEDLLSDARRIFPDNTFHAVCFGQPTPAVIMEKTNDYAASAGAQKGVYPLRVTGRDMMPKSVLEEEIIGKGYFGYKVYLDWLGDNYGHVRIEDMIGPNEMELANALKLVVLLHVPRSGRLADPEVQEGVRRLSADYPDASIVLAHCGRAYLPDEMKQCVHFLEDLPNVYMDTAMVMDPTVMQMAFEHVDSRRILFATDFPVAVMRGRRVYVMDHWVDLVTEGYPESAYRVGSDNMRATYMAIEIVLAISRAAEMARVSSEELSGVFYDNGMSLLSRVMDGRQLDKKGSR